ncbi:hypothetical protein KCP69_02805 [Salmonella enterica subsp. enterica]|nr:hypothetical protein KCP69_02805 [Salmonella enterica subsp. enterica]
MLALSVLPDRSLSFDSSASSFLVVGFVFNRSDLRYHSVYDLNIVKDLIRYGGAHGAVVGRWFSRLCRWDRWIFGSVLL